MAEISLIRNHYEDLRVMFEQVLKEKNSTAPGQPQDVSELRKTAALLFVLIKKINRNVKYRVRAGRDKLQEEKLQMDSKLLQLQNLLYESKHLKREVRNSYQFRSQDEDIDLLPEPEFQQLKGEQYADASPHKLRLGRLECELSLRKQLSEHYKELMTSKRELVNEIDQQMASLASFSPSLEALVKASRPLQEALKMPIEKEYRMSVLLQYLPKPLYLAYMNVNAVQQSLPLEGADIQVSLLGCENGLPDAALNSDVEVMKPYVNVADADFDGHDAMTASPFKVAFSVEDKSYPDSRLEVTLHYFPELELVTASSNVITKEPDTILGELTDLHDILCNLYPNDSGDTMPSYTYSYKLEKCNISTEQCINELGLRRLGRPYRWLLYFCGIECVPTPSPGVKDGSAKAESVPLKPYKVVPSILKCLHSRWASRLNLISQIKALVTKNFDFCLRNEKCPTVKPSCSLVQWTSVDWDEFSANPQSEAYIAQGLCDARNFFYRAVVVRGSAKMECLVSVSHKFPADSPLWIIGIYWNGHHDAGNNAAIKMMESWTNEVQQSQLENKLSMLPYQLVRTMYSFDVFLETESPFYSPVEYSAEKHFLKPFSKRIKARPYRFIEGTANSFRQ